MLEACEGLLGYRKVKLSCRSEIEVNGRCTRAAGCVLALERRAEFASRYIIDFRSSPPSAARFGSTTAPAAQLLSNTLPRASTTPLRQKERSPFLRAAMALVTLVGFPSSGKSTRAQELCSFLAAKLALPSTPPAIARLKTVVINDESLGLAKSSYDGECQLEGESESIANDLALTRNR